MMLAKILSSVLWEGFFGRQNQAVAGISLALSGLEFIEAGHRSVIGKPGEKQAIALSYSVGEIEARRGDESGGLKIAARGSQSRK